VPSKVCLSALLIWHTHILCRYALQDITKHQKGMENDSDVHLAQSIMKNRKFRISTQADDEDTCHGAPTRKSKRKGAELNNESDICQKRTKRIITQQERCVYCFENPNRLKTSGGGYSQFYVPDAATVSASCSWALLHCDIAGKVCLTSV